ncbi:MAG: VCBS repeat-containing protein [bacterium]|nr:VCBS repeat-containing protein [bacterium]
MRFTKVAVLTVGLFLNSLNVNCQTNSTSLDFEKSSQTFESHGTFQIVLGDIDGDGDLDAVFSNMKNYSEVWYNVGNGQFTDSGQQLLKGSHGAALADLDNDGDLDLFLTDNDENESTANKAYINDGKGTFTDSGQKVGFKDGHGNSGYCTDVNSDGFPDIHVNYYKADNKVYLNNNGIISEKSSISFPDGTFVFWGDLDSDGDTDMFVKENGVGLKTMLNDGAGKFEAQWTLKDETITFGHIAIEDFDHDNCPDIFLANGGLDNQYPIRVLKNNGSGRFSDSGQRLPVTNNSRVQTGDFNNDGHIDVFFSNLKEACQLWLNDGNGVFKDSGLRFKDNTIVGLSAVGDLDNDGDLDIFIADYHGGSNGVWFNKIK